VDEALVTGAIRSDSISNNQRALVEARERIIDKHYDSFHDTALASQLFYIGQGFIKLEQPRKARKYLDRAVRTNPRPLYMAALLLSLFPPGVYHTAYTFYKNSHNIRYL
jgi:hypothetical protein